MADEINSQGPARPSRAEIEAENESLRAELLKTRAALDTTVRTVQAEKGPAKGTPVCYQRAGEAFCRPAMVLSDGFSERVPKPGGVFDLHCYLAVGEPPHVIHKDDDGNKFTPGHTFEIQRPWSPLCAPDTWHMLDECHHLGTPKSPYYIAPGETQAP